MKLRKKYLFSWRCMYFYIGTTLVVSFRYWNVLHEGTLFCFLTSDDNVTVDVLNLNGYSVACMVDKFRGKRFVLQLSHDVSTMCKHDFHMQEFKARGTRLSRDHVVYMYSCLEFRVLDLFKRCFIGQISLKCNLHARTLICWRTNAVSLSFGYKQKIEDFKLFERSKSLNVLSYSFASLIDYIGDRLALFIVKLQM